MKNPGIINGIYFGISIIVVSLVLYTMDHRYYLNYRQMYTFIGSIYFIYISAKTARAFLGGYINFRDAFIPSISTWIIGTLIATLFAYTFINFIDQSLIDLTVQIGLESIDKVEEFLGEDVAEQMREGLEDSGVTLSLGAMLLNWVMGLILGAIISAIISAIVKKENPSLD